MSPRIVSFDPVARPGARVLILGSMPSVRSLADSQYYAHPQNAFWPIMGELFGAGRDRPYSQRLRILGERGVALWDVARSCHREQSSDASMRAVVGNDVASLLIRRPRIGAIYLNGRKAEQLFRRLCAASVAALPGREIRTEYLPSTSPANAGMSQAEKLAHWRAVARFLTETTT